MQEASNLEDLRISEGMRESLLSAMKWLNFLNIMCCIGLVLLVLVGIGMIAGASLVSAISSSSAPTGMFPLIGGIYFVIVAVYIYPLKKSFNLVSNTRRAMEGMQDNLEAAAGNLASILRFLGIFTIIAICLYVFCGMLVACAGAAFMN